MTWADLLGGWQRKTSGDWQGDDLAALAGLATGFIGLDVNAPKKQLQLDPGQLSSLGLDKGETLLTE